MLKPYDFFLWRIQNLHVFLGQHCGRIDIVSPQEEIDRHIKFGVIRSQIDGIKLLVHMVVRVDNAADEVDLVKQPILRGTDIPQGVVAWIVDFRIVRHIGAEIVQVNRAFPCYVISVIGWFTICFKSFDEGSIAFGLRDFHGLRVVHPLGFGKVYHLPGADQCVVGPGILINKENPQSTAP